MTRRPRTSCLGWLHFHACTCDLLARARRHAQADDLGWHDVGFQGNSVVHSPTFDALASEGIVLDRYYAAQGCSPSRSAMLSGRLSIHSNEVNTETTVVKAGIPAEMTTLGTQMKASGYATAMQGKWHVNQASYKTIPHGRGFDRSLVAFGHGVDDYYTMVRSSNDCTSVAPPVDLWRNTKPASDLNGTEYSGLSFAREAVGVISAHNTSAGAPPLFMYTAFQQVHTPLQVPFDYEVPLADKGLADGDRRDLLAMVGFLDEALSNITAALKAQAMWNDTLLVVVSDNGGGSRGASNWPLRGAKVRGHATCASTRAQPASRARRAVACLFAVCAIELCDVFARLLSRSRLHAPTRERPSITRRVCPPTAMWYWYTVFEYRTCAPAPVSVVVLARMPLLSPYCSAVLGL